ncbi:MAG: hypothetical protein PHS59_17110 [Paludibacter sp.]|nr:hypothetical protein [Paludibacter sp.]
MYLLAIIFLFTYGLFLFFGEKQTKWRLNQKTTKAAKLLHFIGLGVCVTVSILTVNFDTGLRGLWTTRVFIIVTLLTGIFLRFIADKTIINRFEKWYFRVFSFLPLVSAGILLIPFIGGVLVISIFGQLFAPVKEIYYNDKNYRIQTTFVGVLGPPKVDIYEKTFIFEKRLKESDRFSEGIDSIKVSYDKDSTRITAYGLYDYDEQLKGKTETINLKRKK